MSDINIKSIIRRTLRFETFWLESSEEMREKLAVFAQQVVDCVADDFNANEKIEELEEEIVSLEKDLEDAESEKAKLSEEIDALEDRISDIKSVSEESLRDYRSLARQQEEEIKTLKEALKGPKL